MGFKVAVDSEWAGGALYNHQKGKDYFYTSCHMIVLIFVTRNLF